MKKKKTFRLEFTRSDILSIAIEANSVEAALEKFEEEYTEYDLDCEKGDDLEFQEGYEVHYDF